MKINDALKCIDTGWVRKPKGFRVRFNKFTNGRWESDYSPGETDTPLDSDVTAWRLAWKLAQANCPEVTGFRAGDMVNITVVDDQGSRIRSYITNDYEVYHPQEKMQAEKIDINWR